MAWLRGTATSPPPERKGSLMMDDDRISAALPEGIESNPARWPAPGAAAPGAGQRSRSDGEGGQEPRKRAAVSAGQAG